MSDHKSQQDPSMEEILSSIRRTISEDNEPVAPETEKQAEGGDSDADGEVLELTQMVREDGTTIYISEEPVQSDDEKATPKVTGADKSKESPSRPRSMHLRTVTGFAVVATIAGLGGYVFHQTSTPGVTEVPMIEADDSPVKHRPAEPGGMAIPHQDMLVFATISNEGYPDNTEHPSPPPEELVQSPKPAVEPPPEPTVTASLITGFRVQLAALRSRADAEAAWRRLKRANGDHLGALDARIMRVDLGDRGVFYRLQAGPLASAAKASALCSRLGAHKLDCFVVGP